MSQIKKYRTFLEKIDLKFSEIEKGYGGRMNCKSGCHACCLPGITVLPIEAENIRQFLQRHPEAQAKLMQLEISNPHQGTRCEFLDENGMCSIYEVRPVVCRSHGAPLRWPANPSKLAPDAAWELDFCLLNFSKDSDPEDWFKPDLSINLEALNDVMVALQAEFQPGEARPKHSPLKLAYLSGANG